jgi:hypothetical protein
MARMGYAGLTAMLAAVAGLAMACGDGSASQTDAGSVASRPAARRAVLVPDGFGPLRLNGSGFRARERVRVTVTPSTGSPVVRHVRANGRGRFRIAVAGLDQCAGLEAGATGTRGSRASFQLASGGLACTG